MNCTRLIFRIGIVLFLIGGVATLCSAWLLDHLFLPLGNRLHPEWEPPANFLIPIHWLSSTLIALFATGFLCLLTAVIVHRERPNEPRP